jgi:acetyl-CoA acetyltransferase
MYEAIGLAEPGRGIEFLEHTTLHGDSPVNTGGGLLAFGHPVGATGVKQLIEIMRQMKGRCGSYQIRKPLLGLAVNMGGDDKTIVATLVRNVTSAPTSFCKTSNL